MRLTRWLAGAAAALGLALALAPLSQVQAMTPASSGAASALQSVVGEGTTQARFGGHFGGGHFGGGHFHGGGGGFHHFHGGGFYRPHVFAGPRFYHRPRFYAAYPGPYYAPVYRCPLVWTVYGPRRICAYRRHVVHYYYGRRFAHRYHYVRHYRHARWM